MPAPTLDTTLSWDQLTAEQKGQVIRETMRQAGALESTNGLATEGTDPQLGSMAGYVNGLTDAQLAAAYEAQPTMFGAQFADAPSMLGELQATGNPVYWGMVGDGSQTPTAGTGPYGQAFENGQPSIHTYDPNRGLTPENFENFTGVAPGVSIDLSKYAPSAELQAATEYQRQLADYYQGLDPNRFAIDPSQLMPVDTYNYDPATADIYTTDVSGAFDPTRQQLDYANELTGYAADINGSHLGSAADLAYMAATGQAPSRADLALNRDANALFAAQMALAGRARGSSSSGLAAMNAQNNSQFGYAQLLNNADLARAQEAADARGLYGQLGSTIRQGDLAAAGQAADIGQQLYAVNNAELGAGMSNMQALNQGAQYNTNAINQANQFNVGQRQSASAANAQQLQQTLEGNRQYGAATEANDRLAATGANAAYTGQLNTNIDRGIRGEQDYQQSVNDVTTILGNMYGGHENNRTALQGIEMQSNAQQNAALIGALGTAAAGVGTLIGSDERVKNISGKGRPADFSGVRPMRWTYDEAHEDDVGTEWLEDGEEMESGMAQDMPPDVVEKGKDGMWRVNVPKLLLRLPDAVGDLQRRVQKMEKRS